MQRTARRACVATGGSARQAPLLCEFSFDRARRENAVVKSGGDDKAEATTPHSAGASLAATTATTKDKSDTQSSPFVGRGVRDSSFFVVVFCALTPRARAARFVGKFGLAASATSATTDTSVSKTGGGARAGVKKGGPGDDDDDDDVFASLERRYADEDEDDDEGDEIMDDSKLSEEERAARLMSPNVADHVFVEGTPLERKTRERELAYARYHNLKRFVEESLAAMSATERASRPHPRAFSKAITEHGKYTSTS